MPRGRSQRRRSRPRQRRGVQRQSRASKMQWTLGAVRLPISGHQVPPVTRTPKVQKWVRLEGVLNTATQVHTVTYHNLTDQDSSDYINPPLIPRTPRYPEIRVLRMRMWLETPAPTATQPAHGLAVTDIESGMNFTARPVSGSTYAAVAYQFPLVVRDNIAASTSDDGVFRFGSDLAVPAATTLLYTCDVLCEFS